MKRKAITPDAYNWIYASALFWANYSFIFAIAKVVTGESLFIIAQLSCLGLQLSSLALMCKFKSEQ